MKSVYPELQEKPVAAPTEEEITDIAKAIVIGYDSDGSDWEPYTPPGENDTWKTFEQSYRTVSQLRLVFGLDRAVSITAERKLELRSVLHMTKRADVLVTEAVETTTKEINEAMAAKVAPSDQATLEQSVSSTIVDVTRFTKAFIDVKCEKLDATFKEFEEKYEEAATLDPIIIKTPIIIKESKLWR